MRGASLIKTQRELILRSREAEVRPQYEHIQSLGSQVALVLDTTLGSGQHRWCIEQDAEMLGL